MCAGQNKGGSLKTRTGACMVDDWGRRIRGLLLQRASNLKFSYFLFPTRVWPRWGQRERRETEGGEKKCSKEETQTEPWRPRAILKDYWVTCKSRAPYQTKAHLLGNIDWIYHLSIIKMKPTLNFLGFFFFRFKSPRCSPFDWFQMRMGNNSCY